MSQPSIAAYFNTRKRQACDDLRGKSKVLLLERERTSSQTSTDIENSERSAGDGSASEGTSPTIIMRDTSANSKEGTRASRVIRNIQFDSPKASSEKTSKPRASRATRSRRMPSVDGGQADIRDSLLKLGGNEQGTKTVSFEKKGTLSPKKKQTPKKNPSAVASDGKQAEQEKEQDACGSLTPTSSRKTLMTKKLATENLSLSEIKNRINKSSRLMELRASMRRIMEHDQKLKQLQQKQNDAKKPQMQKFEKIELEVPVR